MRGRLATDCQSALLLFARVTEFEGRSNRRPLDIADQMVSLVNGASGNRMTYDELIGLVETRNPGML